MARTFNLTFKKTQISKINFDDYEFKSFDVGYNYDGERYYLYRYKKDDKFYLIRHLYNFFGSDDILISNEPLTTSERIQLEPFEPLEDDIDTLNE